MAELNDTSEKHAQAHAEAHIQAFAPRDRRRLVRTRALIATAVAVAVGGLLIFTPTRHTLVDAPGRAGRRRAHRSGRGHLFRCPTRSGSNGL